MIKKINHIGIAVRDIKEAAELYTEVLGLKLEAIEVVEHAMVKTAIISVGGSKIELLQPTDPESAIAKYLENKGEGIHHLALEVSDIQDTLETLKRKGIPLIDEVPREGVGGTKIAFLHPKGTKILLELVEPGE